MQILLIMFIALTVAVGLGVTFLFLSKNPKVQNILFYFVALLGMFITATEATSLPSNYVFQIVIAWAVGGISIIGIILKAKRYERLAKWMVSASAVLGLILLMLV